MTSRLPLAAAAALALCSGNVLADASVTASLSQITIELIDLTPDDGISPWISFDIAPYSFASTEAHSSDPPGGAQDQRTGDSAFAGLASVSAPNPYAQGAATIGGDPFAGTLSLQTSAFTMPTGESYSAAHAAVGDPNGSLPAFTLSAGTELVMRAVSDITVTSKAINTGHGGGFTYAADSQVLTLYGVVGDVWQESGQSLDLYATSLQGMDITRSDHRVIEATFRNPLDVATVGNMRVSVIARTGYVPSVPEPAPLALMLAGLGTLGFVSARRRRPLRDTRS